MQLSSPPCGGATGANQTDLLVNAEMSEEGFERKYNFGSDVFRECIVWQSIELRRGFSVRDLKKKKSNTTQQLNVSKLIKQTHTNNRDEVLKWGAYSTAMKNLPR